MAKKVFHTILFALMAVNTPLNAAVSNKEQQRYQEDLARRNRRAEIVAVSAAAGCWVYAISKIGSPPPFIHCGGSFKALLQCVAIALTALLCKAMAIYIYSRAPLYVLALLVLPGVYLFKLSLAQQLESEEGVVAAIYMGSKVLFRRWNPVKRPQADTAWRENAKIKSLTILTTPSESIPGGTFAQNRRLHRL